MNTAIAERQAARKDTKPATERMLSLDTFRGMTIAGMILVNNPGSWSYVYPPLAHAEWNGWTPTDLIFPFFLFIVGIAITISLGGKVERRESKPRIITGLLRRSAILFLLGLFLASFPFFHITTIRIPGVLQRIAVCFLFASLIFLFTSIRGQAVAALALIAVYWALMKLVSVPPDYLAAIVERGGNLEKEGNLAAYIDNSLLHGHLWSQSRTWDPEGLLSTIPAIATVLMGVLAGHWIRSNRDSKQKAVGMALAGVGGVVIGQVMGIFFPINKNLWTSSYVVFTAGMALLFLALCYWLVDHKGYKRWATPFIIYGMNAITVYVLSGVVADLLGLVKEGVAQPDGSVKQVTLHSYYYESFFASWAGPMNGSLLFAIAFVLLMFVPAYLLYRRRIFIKI